MIFRSIICIFLVLSLIINTNCQNSNSSLQLKNTNIYYDWHKVKIIKFLGYYNVEKITQNSIRFSASAGNLADRNWYDYKKENFNVNGIYRIYYKDNEYYFRFGWHQFDYNQTEFIFVNWINGKKPVFPGLMGFEVIDIPVIQTGKKEIAMVGDSIVWSNFGQGLRLNLSKLNPDYKFIGSRTDIYGYSHEGEGGNTTLNVLARLKNINPSDNYTLHIGTNDLSLSPDESFINIKKIIDSLLNKKPGSKVFIMTILPTTDVKRDKRTRKINILIRNYPDWKNRVFIIDTEKKFRAVKNWQTLLTDGVHPNAEGYKILARIINKEFAKKRG